MLGFGLLLDKIADKHVPRNGIVALEFSSAGMDVFRKKSSFALQQDVRVADLESGFDVIFLFQVVEHMDSLDRLFCRIRDLLVPRGRVFISVPKGRKADFQEQSGSLLDMAPSHIGRWSCSAFEIMGARQDWRCRPSIWSHFHLGVSSYRTLRTAICGGPKTWNSGELVALQTQWKMREVDRSRLCCCLAPLRVPVWIKAARVGHVIGGSFWVEFRRLT